MPRLWSWFWSQATKLALSPENSHLTDSRSAFNARSLINRLAKHKWSYFVFVPSDGLKERPRYRRKHKLAKKSARTSFHFCLRRLLREVSIPTRTIIRLSIGSIGSIDSPESPESSSADRDHTTFSAKFEPQFATTCCWMKLEPRWTWTFPPYSSSSLFLSSSLMRQRAASSTIVTVWAVERRKCRWSS